MVQLILYTVRYFHFFQLLMLEKAETLQEEAENIKAELKEVRNVADLTLPDMSSLPNDRCVMKFETISISKYRLKLIPTSILSNFRFSTPQAKKLRV